MTGKTLTQFRTDLVAMMQGSTTEFPDAQVDISVERAVAELSKFLPRELVLDIFIGDRTITDEQFTSSHGNDVSLNNSPLEGLSEKVRSAASGGGTLYNLGTDYEMNYFNGTIKTLSTGSISNTTITYITYEKHGIVVDISGAANLMEALKVESPIDSSDFQEIKSFQIWGTKLFIGAGMKESQKKLLENKNFWLYYTSEWTTPVAGTGSEYPAHLDELVSKGALGFLLIGLSVKKTIEAASELALANADLDLNDAIYTAITADTIHADLQTAVDNITNTLATITLPRTAFTTAIDAVASTLDNMSHDLITKDDSTGALDVANTILDGVSWTEFLERLEDDTKEDALEQAVAAIAALAAVTTEGFGSFNDTIAKADVASVAGSAAATASTPTAADTALGKIDDNIANGTDSVTENETLAQADLVISSGTYLNSETLPAAKKYLIDGDDKIDLVNVGENVASNYANFSLTAIRLAEALNASANIHAQLGANRVGAANAFAAEAAGRLSAERINIEEGQVHVAAGNAFISLAESTLSQHRILLQQAQGYIAAGDSLISQARAYLDQQLARVRQGDGYIAEGRARIEEQLLFVQQAQGYLQEATVRIDFERALIDEAAGYVGEVGARVEAHETYLKEVDRHVADASMRVRTAEGYKELGASYLSLAQTNLAEFFDGLRERSGMRRQRSRASRGQPA